MSLSDGAEYRRIQIMRQEVHRVAVLEHPLSLVVRPLDYPFHLRLSKEVIRLNSTSARARNLCQRDYHVDSSSRIHRQLNYLQAIDRP